MFTDHRAPKFLCYSSPRGALVESLDKEAVSDVPRVADGLLAGAAHDAVVGLAAHPHGCRAALARGAVTTRRVFFLSFWFQGETNRKIA